MRSLKKTTIVCLTVICLLCASVGAFGAAKVGASSFDAADACFLASVSDELDNVEYTRAPLYDADLRQNGWQYDFTADGVYGYALVAQITVSGETVYETEEVELSKSSPFDACLGKPVYITHRRYFDKRGATLYDLETDAPVTAEDAAIYAGRGFAYGGANMITNVTETIDYASKAVTQDYYIPSEIPPYMGTVGASNCACTAGTIAIGYYDRFYENLIPDYKAYIKIGSKIKYRGGGVEVENAMKTLATDMGTDQDGPGTTFQGFQDGMKKYVNRQGYNYSTEDMFSWFSFNFDKFKAAVEAEKPVGLFLPNFAVLNMIDSANGRDTITSKYCDVAHVMIAFGYHVETYYNAAGSVIDTRTYLKVNVGLDFGVALIGYLNLNDMTKINHAIALTIS